MDKEKKTTEEPKTDLTAAEVLVKCLENEGVEYVFGIPGEENLDMMRALEKSSIRVIVKLIYTLPNILPKDIC